MAQLARGLACTTVCSGLGCVCRGEEGADTLTITTQGKATKHCFCGDFQVQHKPVGLTVVTRLYELTAVTV